jgi:hypothetical protein
MRDRLDGVELRVDVFRNEATAEAEGNKRKVMSASSSEPGAERTRLKKPFNPSIINYKNARLGRSSPLVGRDLESKSNHIDPTPMT